MGIIPDGLSCRKVLLSNYKDLNLPENGRMILRLFEAAVIEIG